MKKILTLSLLIAANAFAQTPTPTATPWLQGTQYDKFAVVDASLGLRISPASDATIASAATLNLNNVVGPQIDVTGTTTITAITLTAGERRILRFTGALTLTQGALLLLPGNQNIITANGDFAVVIGGASSVVTVTLYKKASITPQALVADVNGGTISNVDMNFSNRLNGSLNLLGSGSINGTGFTIDTNGINGVTMSASGVGFTASGGTTSKTLTINNSVALSGTDGSTLNIASGGTLGSNAFTSTAFAPLASPSFTTPNINVATGTSLSLGSDPADAGVIRLENAALIGWEASPTGTDVTLTVNSSEQFVFSNAILSPTLVTPALGTPASGVMTNATGTASGLTAGNVTTNANLTGHVTSTGNAAVLGSFTLAQLNTAISDADVANLASPTFTGTPTLPTGSIATTQSAGNSTTAIATTAFVTTADNLKANLASPTFTGTVNAGPVTLTGVLTNSTTINAPMMTSGPNAGGTCGYILFDASANGGKKWRNQASVSVVGDFGFYNESDSLVAFTASANGDLNVTGKVIPNKPVKLKGYTVATLPTGAQGDTCFVTDALAPTFLATVVGGGAVVTPVFYNGTNWVGY